MKVLDPHYGTIIDYKHCIVPIQNGKEFVPNILALEAARKQSVCNILTDDFEKMQKKGKTILINEVGGWCFLTEKMLVMVEPNKFARLNQTYFPN